jgi:hypothetical protein
MASIKITAPITAQWARANARALVNAKAGRRAVRIAPRTYRVVSSQSGDQSYTVYVESIVRLQARCSCPAGVAGLVCWHASAAVAAAISHCAEAQQAAPAPVAAPAPAAPRVTPAEFAARFSRV